MIRPVAAFSQAERCGSREPAFPKCLYTILGGRTTVTRQPPGEPQHHPARTEPCSGVVQSWGCATRAFRPNSLRNLREPAFFFPPL